MQRFLVTLGLLITGIGFFYPLIRKLGIGNLPGDVYLEKGSFKLYFPITTSLLISYIIGLVVVLINKFR